MKQKLQILNTSTIMRGSLAVVLGVLAPLAFIAGGSFFENTHHEALAGYVALTVFCAVCQFLLTRRGHGGLAPNWPVLACMVSGLLAARALGMCANWPQFVAAASGVLAGSLGRAVLSSKHADSVSISV